MKCLHHAMIAMNVLSGAQLTACGAEPPVRADTLETGSTGGTFGSVGTSSATSAETGDELETDGETTDDSSAAGGSGTDDTSEDTGPPKDDDADINAYILGLGHLAVPSPVPAQQIECEGDGCMQDGPKGDYTCDYTYYTVVENFSEFVAFAPNSATLWPGSIVEGADASQGLLTAIGLPRAPMTFSVSLPLVGSTIGHLDAPSLSSYRDELKKVLDSGLQGSVAANFAFELRQVFSEAEMSLALKTSVGWPGGSEISSMFSHDAEQKKTQVIANFVQQYFTVDMDTPLNPADFFRPEVRVEQLDAFMGVDNPPMYLQSLTYGRRAVFSIESTENVEAVHAALSATIQAVAEGKVDIAYTHKKLLNESTMQVFVLGGSAEDGIHAVDGFQGLLTYIKNGASFDKNSPAAPIGYKLAYLDNFGTQFAYTTDFAEADCAYTPDKVRVTLDKLYFHANGCNWKDTNCHQTYEVWVDSPLGKKVLASQQVPKFIDDGQNVGLGVVKDLILPDDPSSWLTIGFSADEDGLTVQTTKKFTFDGGWQGFGSQGITAKTPKNANEDFDVSLFFTLSEL